MMKPRQRDIRLEAVGGAIAVHTPYDPAFVAALKAHIPATDRKWDAAGKVWLVAPSLGPQVACLINTHFHCNVELPAAVGQNSGPTIRVLDVRYIGATKHREDGTESAFGYVNGGWNAIFPGDVLREWFGQEKRPGQAQTLYGILGIRQDASGSEVKAAWKRLARQWHPDVCREPDAKEQFMRIQEAYELLSDPAKRARYNAGLALEATLSVGRHRELVATHTGYRTPLRCGLIMCEGTDTLGRFVVSKILAWQDIVDAQGRTLVTSWPAGADTFTERWV